MWTKLSHFIIVYRLPLMFAVAAITVFMALEMRSVEMSYDFAKIVPPKDPDYQVFQEFKTLFGEDGNIVAVALKDSSLYQPDTFYKYSILTEELGLIDGITSVLSLSNMKMLVKNDSIRKFEIAEVFKDIPKDQQELDSLLALAFDQKFYSGQLINPENGATLILVSIDKEVVNSKQRESVTAQISEVGQQFTEATGIDLHYAGLPFVRSEVTVKVKKELNMFLIISLCVTGLILFLFFRSISAVLVPLFIIGIVVVWTMGTLALLGYKITLLTGLLPSIIVVIGIPNSVYLLNRYHQEFHRHGNKMMAISRIIRKIGIVTLITNFTTAVGFLVLVSTDITILKEFGLVAGINIMATFVVSMVMIPGIFAYLPEPNYKQLKHLKFKGMNAALNGLDLLVHRHKYKVFVVTGVIIGISLIGITRLHSEAYMVDDIPERSKIMTDLQFFEQNFSGIMPLELLVDTRRKRGVQQLKNLEKVDELEMFLDSLPEISKPVSLVSFAKASKQAFYNGDPRFYRLPNKRDQLNISRYLKGNSDTTGIISAFVDTTGRRMRVSLKVADIGSVEMDKLLKGTIEPKIDELFPDSTIQVTVTGTTPLFIKGNKYLIQNLQVSMLMAFGIIAIIMGILFANWRMIIISIIPNVIPLLITGALMGFMGIPLKPSTVLIFSIAFGISVDDSIHFLAKYRQELFANRFFVPVAVSKSLRETGFSMIYTSIILFAGFIIFAWSDFGGTKSLGILTSTTLLIAMFTNLIVLPSLLLAFDSGKRKPDSHPLIEHYDEFYHEDEDLEINLDKIRVYQPANGVPTVKEEQNNREENQ